jgi:hypothetical protein
MDPLSRWSIRISRTILRTCDFLPANQVRDCLGGVYRYLISGGKMILTLGMSGVRRCGDELTGRLLGFYRIMYIWKI